MSGSLFVRDVSNVFPHESLFARSNFSLSCSILRLSLMYLGLSDFASDVASLSRTMELCFLMDAILDDATPACLLFGKRRPGSAKLDLVFRDSVSNASLLLCFVILDDESSVVVYESVPGIRFHPDDDQRELFVGVDALLFGLL